MLTIVASIAKDLIFFFKGFRKLGFSRKPDRPWPSATPNPKVWAADEDERDKVATKLQKKVKAAQLAKVELDAFYTEWGTAAGTFDEKLNKRYNDAMHSASVATVEGSLVEALFYAQEAKRAEEVAASWNLASTMGVEEKDLLACLVSKAKEVNPDSKPKKDEKEKGSAEKETGSAIESPAQKVKKKKAQNEESAPASPGSSKRAKRGGSSAAVDDDTASTKNGGRAASAAGSAAKKARKH